MSCIPPVRKDLSEVFHLPLAAYCAAVQIYLLATSIFGCIQIANSKFTWWHDSGTKGYLNAEDATMISFLVLLMIVNTVGLLGLFLRWNFGLQTMDTGFKLTLISIFVSLMSTAIVLFYTICGVGGGLSLKVMGTRIYGDMVVLALQTLPAASCWHTMSAIKSLQLVIFCGGTGWEKLNYVAIKNMRRTEAYMDTVKS